MLPSPEIQVEPFVDIARIIELLNIPKKTIYKWSCEARLNGFPVYKMGKHLRFRPGEVDAWMKKRCLKSCLGR